jgi:hypothetical protein
MTAPPVNGPSTKYVPAFSMNQRITMMADK